MYKIFFNQGVIKPLKDISVLNFFTEKDTKKSIYVRDTTEDIYVDGRYLIEGGVNFYTIGEDYYVDITKSRGIDLMSGVYGIYMGEGKNFEIKASKQPIFTVSHEKNEFNASSNYYMQGLSAEESMLGMFLEGTEITYRRMGHDIKDVLGSDGWKRVYGPPDDKLGIISIADAHKNFVSENKELSENGTTKKRQEELYRMREALKSGEGNPEVIKSLISAYEDTNENNVYCFLANDMKELKNKKILI